jgi:hypothetical protein
MLSDHERETLEMIQQGLVIEDPRFIEAFERSARGLATRGLAAHRSFLTLLIVIVWTLGVFMIVVRAPGPALLFTVAACCLMWLRRGVPAAMGSRAGSGKAGRSPLGGAPQPRACRQGRCRGDSRRPRV